MAADKKKSYIVTAADIGRFLIIISLGALSILTFMVAGTIVILMAVETNGCDCFKYHPVGLVVLGLLGLLFLIDIIIESVDAPTVIQTWYNESSKNKQAVILLIISLIAIWMVT
jgi:hypothetical protein